MRETGDGRRETRHGEGPVIPSERSESRNRRVPTEGLDPSTGTTAIPHLPTFGRLRLGMATRWVTGISYRNVPGLKS